MTDGETLAQARALAKQEKAAAKQSFAALKTALRPSSIAKRMWGKAVKTSHHTVGGAVETARTHRGLAASIAVGTGLMVVSKPLGRRLADGLRATTDKQVPVRRTT